LAALIAGNTTAVDAALAHRAITRSSAFRASVGIARASIGGHRPTVLNDYPTIDWHRPTVLNDHATIDRHRPTVLHRPSIHPDNAAIGCRSPVDHRGADVGPGLTGIARCIRRRSAGVGVSPGIAPRRGAAVGAAAATAARARRGALDQGERERTNNDAVERVHTMISGAASAGVF
jgi:hypothetical protein